MIRPRRVTAAPNRYVDTPPAPAPMKRKNSVDQSKASKKRKPVQQQLETPAPSSPLAIPTHEPTFARLDGIPPEILFQVSGMLTVPDLLRLSNINRRIKNSMDNQFWATVLEHRMKLSIEEIRGSFRKHVYKHYSHSCSGCKRRGNFPKRKRFGVHIHLCDNCSRPSDITDELITVTRAKKEYKVTEANLKNLPVIERTNPHYSNASPMRLYDLGQVMDEARDNRLEKRIEERTKLKAKRDAHAAVLDAKWAKKTETLKLALEAVGLTIPKDSYLAQAYIVGNGGAGMNAWPVTRVSKMLVLIHRLYEHTDYPAQANSALEAHKNDITLAKRWETDHKVPYENALKQIKDGIKFVKKNPNVEGVCSCGMPVGSI